VKVGGGGELCDRIVELIEQRGEDLPIPTPLVVTSDGAYDTQAIEARGQEPPSRRKRERR
jgi:hypothetical protein